MKKLAIVGASYLQLPLVLKAKELGLETHCFAWEDGAVCRDVCDYFYPISILEKEKILEICQQVKIDGITSIASDSAVPTICFVAEKLGLISNSYNDALSATNKYEMRQRFIRNNVSCPKFVVAEGDYSVEGFRFPLIVKPTDRSGSRGVMKIESLSELNEAVKRAQKESFTMQAIIEEYISGVEVSVETISWKGEHYILAITDKVTTGEPYFVELAHHQPSQVPLHILQNVKKETLNSLNALNIKYGASHSEFKITENGDVYAIETGARMGGDFIGSDLVRLSTGYDYVRAVIEIALGKFNLPRQLYNKFSGVYFLSQESKRLLNVFERSTDFIEIKVINKTDCVLRNLRCSADRSGYIIYQSDTKFIM